VVVGKGSREKVVEVVDRTERGVFCDERVICVWKSTGGWQMRPGHMVPDGALSSSKGKLIGNLVFETVASQETQLPTAWELGRNSELAPNKG